MLVLVYINTVLSLLLRSESRFWFVSTDLAANTLSSYQPRTIKTNYARLALILGEISLDVLL